MNSKIVEDYPVQNSDNSLLMLLRFDLTVKQVKAIQHLLPANYKLEIESTHKRDLTPKPQKKILTNNRNSVVSTSTKFEPTSHYSIRERKNIKTYSPDIKRLQPSIRSIKSPSISETGPVQSLWELLARLKKHKSSKPFHKPVDVEGLGLYDYYDLIREPMDLSMIENKLRNKVYQSKREVERDLRLIWDNAHRYNMEGSTIYKMTTEVERYTENLLRDIEDVPFEELIKGIPAQKTVGIKKNKELVYNKQKKFSDLPVSHEERHALGVNMRKLPHDNLRDICNIVIKALPVEEQKKEEVEFDLELLPNSVVRELIYFVNGVLVKIEKKNMKKGIISNLPRFDIDAKKPITDVRFW
jgi:hypothetical protein